MLLPCLILVAAGGLAKMTLRYSAYHPLALRTTIAAIACGALSYLVASPIEDLLLRLAQTSWDNVPAMALVASVVEELLKLLGVAIVCVWLQCRGGDMLHTIVVGSLVGLGFAVGESAYYTAHSELVTAVAGRELVRLVLHMLLSGVAAMTLGSAKQEFSIGQAWPLGVALVLHFSWDAVCGIPAAFGDPTLVQRGVAVTLMLTLMATFGFCVLQAEAASRNETLPRASYLCWFRASATSVSATLPSTWNSRSAIRTA